MNPENPHALNCEYLRNLLEEAETANDWALADAVRYEYNRIREQMEFWELARYHSFNLCMEAQHTAEKGIL